MASCRENDKSRIWFVIRLHLLLFCGMCTSTSSSPSCNSGTSSGCPVKATTQFFRRNMAFVGKAFMENSPSPVNTPPHQVKHSKRQETLLMSTNHYINPIESKNFLTRLYMSNSDKPPHLGNRKKKRADELIGPGQPPDKASTNGKAAATPTGDMDMVVVGLSHHTAPVEVREKLSISEDGWTRAASDLCKMESITEAAVLSTCNRFELYLTGRNEYEAMRDAVKYLHSRANGTLDEDTLRTSLFLLSGEDAMWHLMRVSSGKGAGHVLCLCV